MMIWWWLCFFVLKAFAYNLHSSSPTSSPLGLVSRKRRQETNIRMVHTVLYATEATPARSLFKDSSKASKQLGIPVGLDRVEKHVQRLMDFRDSTHAAAEGKDEETHQ